MNFGSTSLNTTSIATSKADAPSVYALSSISDGMSLIARYTVTASAGIMPNEIIATYISMPVPKNTKYTASAAV